MGSYTNAPSTSCLCTSNIRRCRVLLFLYCYGYVTHRTLHSFPTRRSSDLELGAEAPARLLHAHDPAAIVEADEARAHVDGREDRKSTRLNSSHANNSYAVFCLKKKRIEKGVQRTREQASQRNYSSASFYSE